MVKITGCGILLIGAVASPALAQSAPPPAGAAAQSPEATGAAADFAPTAPEPAPSPAPAPSAAEARPPGDAEPAKKDSNAVDEAREAFRLGTSLARQGQWLDALAAFQRSAALRPHPVTTYNLAYTERALARYTRATKLFEEAISQHDAGTRGRMPDGMLAQCHKYLAEVRARLAVVGATLSPKGAAIAVDGRPLEPLPSDGKRRLSFRAGTRDPGEPRPVGAEAFDIVVDPGNHVFVVRTPKGASEMVAREVEPGARVSLALSVRPVRPHREPLSPAWMWSAYGIGAAGLLTGAAFGVATLAVRSDLDDTCPSRSSCPRSAQEDLDRAHAFATVANVGFGVGLAGAAAGTLLFFLGGSHGSEKRSPEAEPGIRAWVSPLGAGAGGRF